MPLASTDRTMDAAVRISPGIAAGLGALRMVLESDGSLPASHKALFTAAASAPQQQPDLLRTQLEVVRAHDLPMPDVLGVAPVLLLACGEAAFLTYLDAVSDVFGPGALPTRQKTPPPVASKEEALAYFEEHFGEVPARQRLFSDIAPTAFVSYQLMHRTGLKENALSEQTVELMLCTILAADLQPALLEIHIRSALDNGASHEAVVEAVLSAAPVAGWAVWASSAGALEATRTVAGRA